MFKGSLLLQIDPEIAIAQLFNYEIVAGSSIDVELQLASKYNDTNATLTLSDITAGELWLGRV